MAEQISFRNAGLPNRPVDLKRRFPTVKVYFIGEHLLESVKQVAEDGTVTYGRLPIHAEGHGVYYMPPLGEYLSLPSNIAETLIRQTRFEFPRGHAMEGQYIEGMTLDGRIADAVKRAAAAGKTVDEVVAEDAVDTLSIEALEAALARKKAEPAKQRGPGRPAAAPKDEAK